MNTMKVLKFLLVSLFMAFSITVTASVISTQAAQTGTVNATVTAQNIAVGVSSGTVTYGVVGTGSSKATTATGTNQSQFATNLGNVNETFNIVGQTAGGWALGPAAGDETYFHRWCTTTCDGSPTWWSLSTGYTTLATGVAASGVQEFDLMVGTPITTTDYSSHSVDVVVQATAQ